MTYNAKLSGVPVRLNDGLDDCPATAAMASDAGEFGGDSEVVPAEFARRLERALRAYHAVGRGFFGVPCIADAAKDADDVLSSNKTFTLRTAGCTSSGPTTPIVVIGGETHTITRVEKTDDTAKLKGWAGDR